MSVRVESVTWSEGAPPEAMIQAFSESALTVAVLDALLEDPQLREKVLKALQDEEEKKSEPGP